MTTSAHSPVRRTMRADARRNYERLLDAAEAAFSAHGTESSLEDVARAAGVGIGTLYRHFPTRDALLAALLHDRFDALRARAINLCDALPPREALNTWLRQFATYVTAYRGLPASVLAALGDARSPLYDSCHAMRAAGTRLLTHAQESEAVRPDLEPSELFTLACSLAWATEQDPDRTDRFLTLLMDSLRPRGG